AIKTYFYSQKRKEKNRQAGVSDQVLKRQRRLQRRHEKAARRRKAVKVSTTISEEDKSRYLGAIQACYMSSDDSASDSEAEEGEHREGDDEAEATTVKRKKFLTKKLPWRSTELEDLVKSLDRKSSRRRSSKAAAMMTRRESSENASERLAPQDAPQWAIRLPPLTT
ncbi:unnamed protein product, partial [Porites lobata]